MENDYKYIIYQTINIVNNKIYIGRHREKNLDVFDGYIGCGVNINYPSTYMNPYTAFQYAVKKYGTKNFKRSILYIFDTEEEAIVKESEIVNDSFIKRSDVYNMVIGGGGKKPSGYSMKKIYQFDLNGKLLKEWNNCYDIAEYFQTWKETIYSTIHHKYRYLGYYWSYSKEINIEEYCSPNIPQKVYKYTKEGKLLQIYNSMYIAAKENNYKLCELSNRIKEGALTNGFYYSTKLVDEYIPRQKLSLKNKIIHLYTPDGNYFKSFNVEDLKTFFNVSSSKDFTRGIRTKCLINGYLLDLEKHDKIAPYKGRIKSTKIQLFNGTGDLIDTCDSIQKACKKYGLDGHAVRKCLRGTQKTTKGYIIKKVIEDIV